MGDRIVVMKDGVVQQFDTPQTLYEKPVNLFVAGFIGSPQMNFLDVEIAKEGGRLYAVLGKNKLAVPEFKCDALAPYAGKKVIMGLRPEDFLGQNMLTEDNAMDAEMSFSELLGADYNLYMSVNDIRIIVKIPAAGEQPERGAYRIAANMDHAHFFDKETEQAICH